VNRFIAILALFFFILPGTKGQAPPDPAPNRDNPTGNTGALKGQIETGGSYDAHSGNGTRIVPDLHVPGAVGAYGLDFIRYWNSTQNDFDDSEAQLPLDFGMSGWSHSWRWSAVVGIEYPSEIPGSDRDDDIYKTKITITFPDGHTTKYKIIRARHGWFQVPPSDHVFGPPYSAAEIASGWPAGGFGVRDHICNMATNGTEFWLCRADGGSVHFEGGPAEYRATEVFDPHGLKTTLTYNADGLLNRVEDEGGRFLTLSWSYYADVGWLITRVANGDNAGAQYVTYSYQRQLGFYHVLTRVGYHDEPAPGQTNYAVYTYGTCYGDETAGCVSSNIPLLKRADDPHYAGAMTKIKYNYAGTACQPIIFRPWEHPEWVGGQPYRIAAEKSDAGDTVSMFQLNCDGGEREEWTGLGGHRKFYFGRSANSGSCMGFHLGKLTDITLAAIQIGGGDPCPPGLACQRQNYTWGGPKQIWDGRGLETHQLYAPGDESGSPSTVSYPADGSNSTYDRVNPGSSNSVAANGSGMHNPYNHWLFSETDELGKVTTYTRDSRRRVTQISYYEGSAGGNPVAVESYSYNDLNQVTSHTLPSHTTDHPAMEYFHYNAQQLLEWEYNTVDGWNARKEYTYYSTANHPEWAGLVETMTDGPARSANPPAPFAVRKTYNGRQQVMSEEYPPTGGAASPTVRYEYDRHGNRTAVIDELGHRKDSTYDDYRRCLSTTEQIGPAGDCNNVQVRRWDWIYDRVIEGDTQATRNAYAHTSKEWRVQIEPEFNNLHHRRATSRTFDVNNRMLSEQTGLIQLPNESLGHNLLSGDDIETHRVTYDANGQKSSTTDPLGRVTNYGYDGRNRLETTTEPKRENQQEYPVTRFEYDVAGNKMKVTFPDQKTQRWENYDAFGQARQFFDENNHQTDLTYRWGPMKKLDTVKTYRDGVGTETQETNFDYDGMGRLTKTSFPDTSTEESHYEIGLLTEYKTRRGQKKRIDVYDARGREKHHFWRTPQNEVDLSTPEVGRVWDDANRLTRIWNSFSIIDYTYDDAGGVRTEGTTVTGSAGPNVVRYCRYPNGEVSQVTYPNGTTAVTRNYTARGQLQSETWTGGSVTYAYHRDGKLDFEDYGNGVRSDLDYDGRGLISLTKTYRQSTGQTYAKRDYWRDDRDRILAWQKGSDHTANPMENGRGDRYEYDYEGQLTRASYDVDNPSGNATGAVRADWFHYDAMGNRVGWNDVASRGSMWFDRRENKLNQYQSWYNSYPNPPLHWGSAIYQDDNFPTTPPRWIPPGNGVTMADGWIVASYNALNQPVAIGCTGYGNTYMWLWHDPLGRCVKRWMGDANQQPVSSNSITYFHYDGWNLIQEGTTATAADRVYVHGNRVDEIVASWATGGSLLYHHYDARGNCILQTNGSGGLQEQYEYDAFGWPYFYTATGEPARVNGKPGSPSGNRFLFTGREFLSGLRIYDYRNRIYQPELGRFLQPDSEEFEAGDYNLYRYCHNDPVNKSDPTGLTSLTGWGGGDWDWFNGNVASAQIKEIFGDNGPGGGSGGSKAISAKDEGGKSSPGSVTRTESDIKRGVYQRHQKRLNAAIKHVFGKDAAKVPYQNRGNAPKVVTAFTSKELGAKARQNGQVGATASWGYNDPDSWPHGTIYIASDLVESNTRNTQNAIDGTYVHELSNILDSHLNGDQFTYGDPNHPLDTDTGAAVEIRMFGSLQYP